MNLLNKYQSRSFQFALALLAALEHAGEVTPAMLQTLARDNRLDSYTKVTGPLERSGILEKNGRNYRLSGRFAPFHLAPGTLERDYLAYLLTLPEAELFLSPATREVLGRLGGDPAFFAPVEHFAPPGEALPRDPGPAGFRTLLEAIRTGRMIRYRYRTRADAAYRECVMTPWKLEYSAYDRRWWVILYDEEAGRTIKARLGSLRDIVPDAPSSVTRAQIDRAMEDLLAPEPMVLRAADVRNVVERCFLVLENQLFTETVLESDGSCRMEFRYYRFDEDEILRRLLYLGPDVQLVGPESMKRRLLDLVEQALEP